MFEDPPVLTRFQLRTRKNLTYGCDRSDQQSPLKREAEKLGFGSAGEKTRNQTNDPIIFLHRLHAAREQCPVADPIFVTGCDITTSFFVQAIHEPLAEPAKLAPEQEDERDEAVFCPPHQ